MKPRDFPDRVHGGGATATGTARTCIDERMEAPNPHGFHATLKAKPGWATHWWTCFSKRRPSKRQTA